MSELVKIDPKSIGIGEYQHDVNQKLLSDNLDFTVSKVVNEVGVNINTSSQFVLNYVSGLTKSIIEKRSIYNAEGYGMLILYHNLEGYVYLFFGDTIEENDKTVTLNIENILNVRVSAMSKYQSGKKLPKKYANRDCYMMYIGPEFDNPLELNLPEDHVINRKVKQGKNHGEVLVPLSFLNDNVELFFL